MIQDNLVKTGSAVVESSTLNQNLKMQTCVFCWRHLWGTFLFDCRKRKQERKIESNTKAVGSEVYEPPRDKTNKMACAPSEDSDQPGHPPSLI